MLKDDDHARKLLDKEEEALYRKAYNESWRPLPEIYRKHGKKSWAYKESSRRSLQRKGKITR